MGPNRAACATQGLYLPQPRPLPGGQQCLKQASSHARYIAAQLVVA